MNAFMCHKIFDLALVIPRTVQLRASTCAVVVV